MICLLSVFLSIETIVVFRSRMVVFSECRKRLGGLQQYPVNVVPQKRHTTAIAKVKKIM